ncbi:bifunctional proline dehydrogenase/L-glutamate gamma-semialdehyde dehydrogenase PutA [Pseudoruegeria sp. HB172150]|uniref:bifunctional proline dehydrogenase/L-glutamate gamma-semialdehyde dehydrogenase PutA n=1 Tax=Pseudoruegeria sp. HB172150 TaxID=2721164 RepID=UPI0015524A7E|nr:bifunctional proline dehydrogenase/L-glutamate gamma-semialdehyde dehydrogenase PutA [Pseudoruegeria sp. HB172150]
MTLTALRDRIDAATYSDEDATLSRLIATADLDDNARHRICTRTAQLVRDIRASARPGLMEVFLAEYGLSTDEGIALMCLAEALLRVPDADTIDALIEDKIAPADWGRHLGHSSSSLVNASTWALMLTGRVLDDRQPGVAGALRGAVKRLGEPVIRKAVGRAMREMGRQFVLGESIEAAMERAKGMEAMGYTYSYDMLGEAARTDADAQRYFDAYARAITAIGRAAKGDIRDTPGISVKLSALHPRYEEAQRDRVLAELTPRLAALAKQAADVNIGLNIDAEEADLLSLSLDVIEAVLRDEGLAQWDGFGLVVQAYGPRALPVIDWLHGLAETLDRRFTLRLVKGAYWDSEIKHAQVIGVDGFPVFSRKPATDVSYIACARRLLTLTDRIYPQFATHNAHTAAAILEMADSRETWEFQRLHGMGERLHDLLMQDPGARCRVYAPVGAHRDLLAYLVRRLLENGANSSFVHQIVDASVPPETVAADPFTALDSTPVRVRKGPEIFLPDRSNSKGWDLAHRPALKTLNKERDAHRATPFAAAPILATDALPQGNDEPQCNPANPDDLVGHVKNATPDEVEAALAQARPWEAPLEERQRILIRAAELYEEHHARLFAILAREAGKSLPDAIGELREAADFLRYYTERAADLDRPAIGTFTCISPWNFPLAIFTGQIAGALASGNAVLAKPAEQTPLIGHAAIELLHEAGVPRHALQFLPGSGPVVGAALTSDTRVNGVAFTGSTETAQAIRRAMAKNLTPGAPFIAETGGINAMIVDSTALPEQAVRDVLASAFQSAGQRCSALRCLYVQEDIADSFRAMLFGAMDTLMLGDPWHLATDVGPVIDAEAKNSIDAYIATARDQNRILHRLNAPASGHFVPPTVIQVRGIADIEREVFGPVLHIATFKPEQLDTVLQDIRNSGYGLTFGLHTRIDDRVQYVTERLSVGNAYVNRNQIGAIVGSQPFGGEGLSGTGPKAGGPEYLARFTASERVSFPADRGDSLPLQTAQSRIDAAIQAVKPIETVNLPGPTGESNRLTRVARPPLLCLGPGAQAAENQLQAIERLGGTGIAYPETLAPGDLTDLQGFSGAVWWGDDGTARSFAMALAERAGPILPLITGALTAPDVQLERHLCIDTTAAGGNAALLAEVSGA